MTLVTHQWDFFSVLFCKNSTLFLFCDVEEPNSMTDFQLNLTHSAHYSEDRPKRVSDLGQNKSSLLMVLRLKHRNKVTSKCVKNLLFWCLNKMQRRGIRGGQSVTSVSYISTAHHGLPSLAGFLLTPFLTDCPLHHFHCLDCPYLQPHRIDNTC